MPYSQQLNSIKPKIRKWFETKREDRKNIDLDTPNCKLYELLMPAMIDDIQVDQLVSPPQDINDRFSKFLMTGFKSTIWEGCAEDSEVFCLGDFFIFVLEGSVMVDSVPKRGNGGEMETRKSGQFQQIFTEWKVLQSPNFVASANLKVSSLAGEKVHFIYCERALFDRFKHDIIKEDRQTKIKFFNTFLFCGKSASFPVSAVSLANYQRGKEIPFQDNQVIIIKRGSAVLHLSNPTNPKEKWKFTLVRGGFLSLGMMMEHFKCEIKQVNIFTEKYVSEDCSVLMMPFSDFTRALRNDAQTSKKLIDKITDIWNSRYGVIQKTFSAKESIKQAQEGLLVVNYPIVLKKNKKSRNFRNRYHSLQNSEYEEFMTFNKYEIMTQNKKRVEQKHMMYSHISDALREKQKQDRIMKKLQTQAGLKELRKNQYNARWKQTKIQHLAIKECITNTQKYREKPHGVKFIFQEDKISETVKDQYLRKTISGMNNMTPTQNGGETFNNSDDNFIPKSVYSKSSGSTSKGFKLKRKTTLGDNLHTSIRSSARKQNRPITESLNDCISKSYGGEQLFRKSVRQTTEKYEQKQPTMSKIL